MKRAALRQGAWLAGGMALAFVVPFVFADVLALPRDAYYGLYAASVAGFFALWVRKSDATPTELVRRRLSTALVLSAVAGVILVFIVLGKAATSGPHGPELAAAVVWRGIVYGAADGLLLSVFPILVVFAMFERGRAPRRLRANLAIGAAALAVSMAMTAVYHAGYSDFRSGKIRQPIAGDVIWSAPTLLTLNPLGAPVAHAALHTAAVVHSYRTDLFLPPHGASSAHAQR